MKLFNLTKEQSAGDTKTSTVIAQNVTKTMVDNIISKTPKVVYDTMFLITPSNH